MIRLSTTLPVAAFALLVFGTNLASAQDGWPDYGGQIPGRGNGYYFDLWKIILLAIPFLLWVPTADWIGRDMITHGKATKMNPKIWNPVIVFTFFFAMLIFGFGPFIPLFIVNWLLVMLAYIVPFMVYVFMRNPKVPEQDRVFTPDHIKRCFTEFGKAKADNVQKEAYEYGAPVEFVPQGGTDQQNQSNLIASRQSPAFVPAKELIADAINQRADKILMDFTAEGVSVKYMVDGNWLAANPKVHEKLPLNRELGDAMLMIYKRMSGLKPEDRRTRQDGKMRIDYLGNKYSTTLTTQGTQTGERVLFSLLKQVKNPPTLEELGMREPHRQKLKEYLAVKNNLVIMCSMPGDGLSASWTGMLKFSDRLTRDYICFEDSNKRELEVENIEIHRYDGAAGETPMKHLYNVSLKQPEVYCIPELTEVESLNFLVNEVQLEERKGIFGFRAKEGLEVILRLLALKPKDPQGLIKSLGLIVNQRLIRKLCDGCKEAYPASPELCQKLGIPAGRVQNFYREKQPPPPDADPKAKKKKEEICPKCRGMLYHGRTAIYELIAIDDTLRQAIMQQPKIEVLRQVSRKCGNWSLQEEGILLLAQGTISLTELQRVLKQ
jgi:type II secretory ATPase GspE/PulE/Tfp pilus assembly ATPase PilB-like protein